MQDRVGVGKVQLKEVHNSALESRAWQATSPGEVDTGMSDSNFH